MDMLAGDFKANCPNKSFTYWGNFVLMFSL